MEGCLTFEQLPAAVAQLYDKLDNIEQLLLNEKLNNPEAERWMDLSELVAYLPNKPVKVTVYGWTHRSLIPYHRRGKKLYFLKSEIDAWLKAGKHRTILEASELAGNSHKSKVGKMNAIQSK